MFEREHELLEYVASHFPNQPHIQEQLRAIGAKLKAEAEKVAEGAEHVGEAVAEVALSNLGAFQE